MDILVETFDVDVTADGSTHTLSNAGPSTSAMMLRHNNASLKAGAGPTGSTGNQDPNDLCVGFELTDTSTITWRRGNVSTSTKVVGECWRYVGSPGGANEFINRGIFQVTISGTSASEAVAGIVTPAKCVPILLGFTTTEASRSDFEQCTFGVRMDGSNVTVSRNNSGTTATVFVQVIEFTGSNWTVATATSSSHDTSDETVTLSQSIVDWSQTWIEASMEGDSAETGLSDCECCFVPGPSVTEVTCALHAYGDGNARNDASAYIYAIRNPDITVWRRSGSNIIAEGNGSYGTAAWPTGAPTDIDLDKLALQWFVDTTGTGTAWGRGCLGTRITASDTITHWVHRSGNNVGATYGVIDLSALVSGGGSVALVVDSLAQSQDADSPTATEHSVLTANSVDQQQTAGTASLTEHSGVTTDSLNQTQSAEAASLAAHSSLTADDVTQDAAIGEPAMNQASVISADPVQQLNAVGVTSLTQAHLIVLDGVVQSGAIQASNLTQAHSVAVASIIQQQFVDVVTYQTANSIAVQSAAQDQSLDVTALTQRYVMEIQSVLQGHSISSVLLQTGLLIDGIGQNQIIDPAALQQAHVIAVGDLTQEQIIDAVGYAELVIGKLNGHIALIASGDVSFYLALNGEVRNTPALTASSLKNTH